MNRDVQATAFLKTLTVLLVEDDPNALEETGIFLRRRVGTLLTAADGGSGLAAFAAERPALVVTDIQMPRLDGLAMVREIRALDPDVPVIVMTAFERTDYLLRSIELGIDRYVLKPIQAGPLEAALTACAFRLLADEQARLQERREAELVQARHEAARGALLGGLAHDYNNLLQAILASVDLAQMSVAPDSAARKFMDLARRSSEEARQLSKRLTLLGQGAEGLDEVSPLEPLLREVVEATLAGSGVSLAWDLGGGSPSVRHNAGNLAQVFRNLAQNAREAMPEGGTLRVESALEGGRLCLSFLDTGPGIPPEVLPQVFEPYFSTKSRGAHRGMGLGLAVCEAIVRAHGGTLTAATEPGRGAAFVLRLPLADGVGLV